MYPSLPPFKEIKESEKKKEKKRRRQKKKKKKERKTEKKKRERERKEKNTSPTRRSVLVFYWSKGVAFSSYDCSAPSLGRKYNCLPEAEMAIGATPSK